MMRVARYVLVAIAVLAAVTGCRKESPEPAEADTFSFVVYPGARYLAQLTDLTKQAHTTMKPNEPDPPPTAIYDVDAPVEEVATYYAKSYGYGDVAPDATNNLSAARPQAYYRTGDLGVDVRAIQDLLTKMNVKTDVSKAAGTYKSAEIAPRPNRPRVTVQRPYFDLTTSEVVDRTLILMTR